MIMILMTLRTVMKVINDTIVDSATDEGSYGSYDGRGG